MMKRVFLLSAYILSTLAVNAQYAGITAQQHAKHAPFVTAHTMPGRTSAPRHSARTTVTAFVAEDFGSGTDISLPTGWTTGTLSTGTWKWANTASTSAYTMGAMASSSAGNGWMIFNSDSIGTICSCTPAGWLQSPAYNCNAHPHVRLNFEDYFRKLEDTCYVWVSTDPSFATYTSYPVWLNNELTDNTFSANPVNVSINISAAAGGHSAVYLRFVTNTAFTGGAYSWMIDDMTLSDPDSVDIGLSKSAVLYDAGSRPYSFGAMPATMVPPVYPVTHIANYGFTAQAGLQVNGQIFQGISNVYNADVTINAPINAWDTIADFSTATPSSYYSDTMALYTVPMSVSPAGDAIAANNNDTATYVVTDTIWSENTPTSYPTTSFFIYQPGSPAYAFSAGTMFAVPTGQLDTLTSVSVAFGSETKAGQVAGVQIYHFDVPSTTWVYDGLTQFTALAAADISPAGGLSYATFMVDEAGSGGKIILQGGRLYGAIVKGNNNTDTVSVLEGNNPANYRLIGYTGLADTSGNDGGNTHTFQDMAGNELTPFINLNFSPIDYTAVRNIAGNNYLGQPYPNPANTSVTIPATLAQDAAIEATLTDVTGQRIATHTIMAQTGKQVMITFETGNLPDGIYLYNLNINGQQKNGCIVVAH